MIYLGAHYSERQGLMGYTEGSRMLKGGSRMLVRDQDYLSKLGSRMLMREIKTVDY